MEIYSRGNSLARFEFLAGWPTFLSSSVVGRPRRVVAFKRPRQKRFLFFPLSLFLRHSVLLRISLVSTPFPFCVPTASLCLVALYLFPLYLSLSPSSRIPCSPFFSFEHALRAAPVSTSYCLVALLPGSLAHLLFIGKENLYTSYRSPSYLILDLRFCGSHLSFFFFVFPFFLFLFFVSLFVGAACLTSGVLLLRLASLSPSHSPLGGPRKMQLFLPPTSTSSAFFPPSSYA